MLKKSKTKFFAPDDRNRAFKNPKEAMLMSGSEFSTDRRLC